MSEFARYTRAPNTVDLRNTREFERSAPPEVSRIEGFDRTEFARGTAVKSRRKRDAYKSPPLFNQDQFAGIRSSDGNDRDFV